MRHLGAAAMWGTGMAAIGMLALGAPAVGAEHQRSYPYISGEVDIEIQNDGVYHSEDPTEEGYNLSAEIEPVIVLHLIDGLSALAHATIEQSSPHRRGETASSPGMGCSWSDCTWNTRTSVSPSWAASSR